jgi:hypothetical protein
MKLHLINLLFFFSCLVLTGQNDPEPVGSRAGGLANASVTLSDIWSIQNNQAGLADLEFMEAAVFYKNRFFVEGLDYQGVAFTYPTNSGVLGLSYLSEGLDTYKETKLGLAYGRKLSEIVNIGVQVNYHSTRIRQFEFGSANTLTAEVGVMADVTNEIRIAAHLFNPTRSILVEDPEERIRTLFKVGAQYTFSEKAMMTAEVVKDIDADEAIRLGVEYMVVDMVYIRAGVGTEPTLTGFGIGMEVSQLKLDVAAIYDNNLGYSPTISLAYQIDRNSE